MMVTPLGWEGSSTIGKTWGDHGVNSTFWVGVIWFSHYIIHLVFFSEGYFRIFFVINFGSMSLYFLF